MIRLAEDAEEAFMLHKAEEAHLLKKMIRLAEDAEEHHVLKKAEHKHSKSKDKHKSKKKSNPHYSLPYLSSVKKTASSKYVRDRKDSYWAGMDVVKERNLDRIMAAEAARYENRPVGDKRGRADSVEF
jgi:hypothetical protein